MQLQSPRRRPHPGPAPTVHRLPVHQSTALTALAAQPSHESTAFARHRRAAAPRFAGPGDSGEVLEAASDAHRLGLHRAPRVARRRASSPRLERRHRPGLGRIGEAELRPPSPTHAMPALAHASGRAQRRCAWWPQATTARFASTTAETGQPCSLASVTESHRTTRAGGALVVDGAVAVTASIDHDVRCVGPRQRHVPSTAHSGGHRDRRDRSSGASLRAVAGRHPLRAPASCQVGHQLIVVVRCSAQGSVVEWDLSTRSEPPRRLPMPLALAVHRTSPATTSTSLVATAHRIRAERASRRLGSTVHLPPGPPPPAGPPRWRSLGDQPRGRAATTGRCTRLRPGALEGGEERHLSHASARPGQARRHRRRHRRPRPQRAAVERGHRHPQSACWKLAPGPGTKPVRILRDGQRIAVGRRRGSPAVALLPPRWASRRSCSTTWSRRASPCRGGCPACFAWDGVLVGALPSKARSNGGVSTAEGATLAGPPRPHRHACVEHGARRAPADRRVPQLPVRARIRPRAPPAGVGPVAPVPGVESEARVVRSGSRPSTSAPRRPLADGRRC